SRPPAPWSSRRTRVASAAWMRLCRRRRPTGGREGSRAPAAPVSGARPRSTVILSPARPAVRAYSCQQAAGLYRRAGERFTRGEGGGEGRRTGGAGTAQGRHEAGPDPKSATVRGEAPVGGSSALGGLDPVEGPPEGHLRPVVVDVGPAAPEPLLRPGSGPQGPL